MTLKEWMEQNNVSRKQVREFLGVSEAMMSRVLRGQLKFKPENIKKLEGFTGGAVLFADWYPDK